MSGWAELWMIDCFVSVYAIHIMGEQKYFDTLKGLVKYTDPDWIKVFKLFEDLRENDVLMQGAVTMVNKIAEQTFANERAAFALNGSWCVNVYAGMNPELEYGAFSLPKVIPSKDLKVWGGVGSSFVVNANSKRKIKRLLFLNG